MASLSSDSDDEQAVVCRPCGKFSTAAVYCKTCREFQCIDCAKGHLKYSFMSGHDLSTSKQNIHIKEDDLLKFDDFVHCSNHDLNRNYYCWSDKVPCCMKCAISDHKACAKVARLNILDLISSSSNETAKELQVRVHVLRKQVNMLAKTNETLNENQQKQFNDVKRKMEDAKQTLFTRFERFTTEILQNVNKDEKYYQNLFEERAESCQDLLVELHGISQGLEQMEQLSAFESYFSQRHWSSKQLACEAKHRKLRLTGETIHPSLVLDNKTTSMSTFKSDFGSYYLMKSTTSHQITDLRGVSLKQAKTITVKRSLDDEYTHMITGLDFLPNGNLIVVDHANKNVKQFDNNLKEISSAKMWIAPTDIVGLSNDEFAVGSDNQIHTCKINKNEITSKNASTTNIASSRKINAISLKDDLNFVVNMSGSRYPARIVNKDGHQVLIDVCCSKDYENRTTRTLYFKTEISDIVVVSVKETNEVHIYHLDMNFSTRMSDKRILTPGYMCKGPEDTFFVCCHSSTILQCSIDGTIVKMLDTRSEISNDERENSSSVMSISSVSAKTENMSFNNRIPNTISCVAMSKDQKRLAVGGGSAVLLYEIELPERSLLSSNKNLF